MNFTFLLYTNWPAARHSRGAEAPSASGATGGDPGRGCARPAATSLSPSLCFAFRKPAGKVRQ